MTTLDKIERWEDAIEVFKANVSNCSAWSLEDIGLKVDEMIRVLAPAPLSNEETEVSMLTFQLSAPADKQP